MPQEINMLIVCDPSQENLNVQGRVKSMSEIGIKDYSPNITLLLAVDHSRTSSSADNDSLYRDGDYIQSLQTPFKDLGVATNLLVSWSTQWSESILHAAAATNATSILVSGPKEKTSTSFNDEFWKLLRHTTVPVAIVQNRRESKRKNVVVAIDLAGEGEEIEGLNRRVFTAGKTIADRYGVDLHLAAAYPSSDQYPDRGKILRLTNLPNENLHFRNGSLEHVLYEVTSELETDLLILGAERRGELKTKLRGLKLTRVLHEVEHDILVVV